MIARQRKKLDRLIDRLSDASFECGDWRSNYDESFDWFYVRSLKARQALTAYVEELTAAKERNP